MYRIYSGCHILLKATSTFIPQGAQTLPTKLQVARAHSCVCTKAEGDGKAANYKQSALGQHNMRCVRDVLSPQRNAKHSFASLSHSLFYSNSVTPYVPSAITATAELSQYIQVGSDSSSRFGGTKHKSVQTSISCYGAVEKEAELLCQRCHQRWKHGMACLCCTGRAGLWGGWVCLGPFCFVCF